MVGARGKGRKRCIPSVFAGKPEAKKLLERLGCRWVNNIKMYFKRHKIWA
jgi:hypothetical protein